MAPKLKLCTYMTLCLLLLAALSQAFGKRSLLLPLSISAISYDGISATDKTWFYLNSSGNNLPAGGGVFPDPEFLAGRPVNTDKAVILRTKGNLQVTYNVYNPNSTAMATTFAVADSTFRRTSASVSDVTLSATASHTSFTTPATGWFPVTVTYAGLPSDVCIGDVYAKIDITSRAGGVSSIQATKQCHLYQVDATPVGHMASPWTDVLDKSCVFCNGKTGESDIKKFNTTGLANSNMFMYTPSGSQWLGYTSPNQGKFNLRGLMNSVTQPDGECRDVSSFLQLCFQSQGYTCDLKQFWTGTVVSGEGELFRTNPIKAIGQSSYEVTTWHFHQVVTKSAKVFDACARQRYDLTGANFFDAPYNWDENGYWQTANGAAFLGLVDGYDGFSTGVVDLDKRAAYLSSPPTTDVLLLQGVY